jgi:hypothetical protein
MKKKVYIVIDQCESWQQQIYGSKRKLLESFLVSECEEYDDRIDSIISRNDCKCIKCKNEIGLGKNDCYICLCCKNCELFYCINCDMCSKCNEKLISRNEANEAFKNKMKENFEKNGSKSLENYYFDCRIHEEMIEFSDED